MGTNATQVRADIARSRGELGETIGALDQRLAETREEVIDRVSPKRVWHRKTDELRQRVNSVAGSVTRTTNRTEEQVSMGRSRVRGEMQELADKSSANMGGAANGARERQAGLRQRAEDNPMAMGLVALGAGVLFASVLPPTSAERRAAQRLRSELGPLQERAGQAGRQLADDVSQSAQEHLQQVKERAGGAVEKVKQDSMSSSEEVKSEAQAATGRVKGEAKESTRRVKSQASRPAASPTSSKTQPRRRPVRAR